MAGLMEKDKKVTKVRAPLRRFSGSISVEISDYCAILIDFRVITEPDQHPKPNKEGITKKMTINCRHTQ